MGAQMAPHRITNTAPDGLLFNTPEDKVAALHITQHDVGPERYRKYHFYTARDTSALRDRHTCPRMYSRPTNTLASPISLQDTPHIVPSIMDAILIPTIGMPNGRLFLTAILLAVAAKAFYNIYLHPLAHFPGPKIYAASSLPVAFAQLSGKFHRFTQTAHEQYGAVVRISPNELSFISPAAWSDIYTRRQGKPPVPRDKSFFNELGLDERTLIMANDETHSRLRRAMNPAFGQRALTMQEPIIKRNVDLLLHQLQIHSERELIIDLRLWYNYTVFDMIGDLAFGESFGCLTTSTYHKWVSVTENLLFMATLFQVMHRYCRLSWLLAVMLPRSLKDGKENFRQMILDKIRRRVRMDTERADFIDTLIKAKEHDLITTDELERQPSVLVLAGSGTTTAALTSATYLLLQHPTALAELTRELHAHFQSESQIDVLSLNKLHYLQAVVQEALRLFPPLMDGIPRRTIESGAVVDGHFVPHGTIVSIGHWSAYRSEANFSRPNEFIPERWLRHSQFNGDAKEAFQPFAVGPQSCIGKRFAYDSLKLILARCIWSFRMTMMPTSEKDYSRDQPSYVSLHQPPLLVKIEAKEN